jgi:hypothetical protein
VNIKIRGEKYVVGYVKRLPGDILGQWTPGRIQLLDSLARDELMQVAIHEGLHACQADLSEDAVEEISAGLATILWNLGYRRAEL